ncbi:g3372 [Coccomyxa viridis]|uniref:G3372 protein n=1 Tax=Coccomyxa viridis TaxID=1274662 RepID=A0ABP1FMN6_9CHLO
MASRIYVGNLPTSITERDLEEEFIRFGTLKSVWVARKPPGFAFVEFEDLRDAEDAVHRLDGFKGWRVEISRNRGPRWNDAPRGRPRSPPPYRRRSPTPDRYRRRSPSYDRAGRDYRRRSPSYDKGARDDRRRSPSYEPPPRRRSPSYEPRVRSRSPVRGRGLSRSPVD